MSPMFQYDITIPYDDMNCVNWFMSRCKWGAPEVSEITDKDDSACAASGEAFPSAEAKFGGTWTKIFAQMKRCMLGMNGGRYVQIDWDPTDFASKWAPGEINTPKIPSSFGLCIASGRCKDRAIKRLLVPLFWLYSHTRGPDYLNHDQFLWKADQLYRNARTVELDDPGKPVVTHLDDSFIDVYNKAFQERSRAYPHKLVSGLVCVTGHLRSFVHPQIYSNIRRNVIDSLNFTDSKVVMLTEIGADDPDAGLSCTKNRAPSWQAAAQGLDALNPDVVVSMDFPIEGHPPERRCHSHYPLSCNAQWRRAEQCMKHLYLLEAARGSKFDWIVRMRPDVLFDVPLWDIRAYDPNKVYIPMTAFTDTTDTFAMVPRKYAEIYFSNRAHSGTNYCWDVPRELVRTDDCRARLHLWMKQHKVPVEMTGFEFNIVRTETFRTKPCDPYHEEVNTSTPAAPHEIRAAPKPYNVQQATDGI